MARKGMVKWLPARM